MSMTEPGFKPRLLCVQVRAYLCDNELLHTALEREKGVKLPFFAWAGLLVALVLDPVQTE